MWNKTLAAVRSLGQRGFYVAAGEYTRYSASLFSRYAHKTLVYPSPIASPDDFMEWLLNELKAGDYAMALPTELSTQQLIARNIKRVGKLTGFPFPSFRAAQKAHDKAWLMGFGQKKGYPVPKTYFIDDIGDLHAVAGEIDFPSVIKPRASSGSRGIAYVKDKSAFVDDYMRVHARYPYPIVQEYIPHSEGGGLGVGALFNMKGEPRAAFCYRRLREYPVSGGPSTLRESIKDGELKEIAFSLLKDIGWKGPAMVEFKMDPRDGRPKLLEINPRLWGSLSLAILSGVDFPYLLYRLAVEGDCEEVYEYKKGVKCRWLIPGDLMHLITNRDRVRTLRKFFERADGDDILSFADPLPIIGRLSSLIPFVCDKEMRKLISR